jgi:predicted DNA-binding antitoxin AbrB/MazE fold protein
MLIMTTPIPVVVENGMLRPLKPLNLVEGQRYEATLNPIDDDDVALRAALGEGVQWPDTSDDSDAYLEDMAEELARAFSSDRLMSDLISEERDER